MELAKLKETAKAKQKETKSFLDKIKNKKPRNLDIVLNDIHDEVFSSFDCLSCANCCKTTGPLLNEKDIEILAKHFKIKPRDFIEKYLRKDEDSDLVFKSMPCPFLAADNYCLVYDIRPKACKEYPHTNRRKFYQINHLTLKNVEICPGAFEIIEKLKIELKF